MVKNVCAQAVTEQSLLRAVYAVFTDKGLRKAGVSCFCSAFYNFFYRQYKSALLKNVPVVNVEHPLDEKIPFLPKKVKMYLDFIAFWIRAAGFLIRAYPDRKADIADFIRSMGDLYKAAAAVYARVLSTTKRPAYFGSFRFVLIHAFDPHLMCIPSLHVMVVIRAYTAFSALVRGYGGGADQAVELRRGALAITEAVLYVKQHSVNCVAAAMYAMTRFDPPRFPADEAEAFAAALFTDGAIPPEDAALIRERVITLYRRFLDESASAPDWTAPLLEFLKHPQE